MEDLLELEEWINTKLPIDGEWYDEENSEAFKELAKWLKENDQMPNEKVKELLHNAYTSVAAEFGN